MDFKAKFLATKIKTRPMEREWADTLKSMNQGLMKQRNAQRLRKKLLTLGGSEALLAPGGKAISDFEINRLLTRGEFWPGNKATLNLMGHNNCHGNSLCLWDEGVGELVTGFALSKDGLWREHSWVKKGEKLIETTVLRLAYFGVILTEPEIKAEFDPAYMHVSTFKV